MRKVFEIGGFIAAAVLVAFGVATIFISFQGNNTVNTSLKQEQITGTPDMTPTGIAAEVATARKAQSQLFQKLNAAGVKMTPSPIETPSCSVADKLISNGTQARCFAQYMRIHTFGSSSGLTYSQMGRYLATSNAPLKVTDGLGGTNDPMYAQIDPKTQGTVSNGKRDIWVTYTALTTALNTSYMAAQMAMFGIVVGVALLLAGFGFGILAISGALRHPHSALDWITKRFTRKTPAVPVA
jgi:predicted peroxiredoxin